MTIVHGDPPDDHDPATAKFVPYYSDDATARAALKSQVDPGGGSGFDYTGTGSPEGTITADTNQTYLDLSSGGVWVFQGTDGTNTGWVGGGGGGGGGGGQTLVIANDEDITVAANPGTTIVLYTALTASRAVSLPPASSVSMTVVVQDGTGSASSGQPISTFADGADTIVGQSEIAETFAIYTSGLSITLINDGISKWYSINATVELEDVYEVQTVFSAKIDAAGSVTAPSGGSTVDTEARTAIAAIIAALVPPA